MDSAINKTLAYLHPISLEETERVSFYDRTDTKFVMSYDKLQLLLQKIKGDYYVLEIDGKRYFSYSTIYYDTPDLRMYIDHVRGKLNRFKVRHRQYVDTGMAFLEVKFKNNSGRTFKWREEQQHANGNILFAENHLLKNHLPSYFKNLKPVLKNNFHRITLVNKEFTQRVTIDFDIIYHTLDNKDHKRQFSDLIIIEIKSDKNKDENGIQHALNNLRIKQSGFSKYCMGVALTSINTDKNGALKSKFIKINKLTGKQLNR